MATTSLWHIKGKLRDLIDYVENPEKTKLTSDMQNFVNVFSYDINPNKTNTNSLLLQSTVKRKLYLSK